MALAPDLNELGFYVLAGAPEVARRPARRGPPPARRSASGRRSSPSGSTSRRRRRCPARSARCRTTLGIATAATNHNTRHPLVTASFATTMHRLTGGRFTLGLGRGIAPLFDAYGIPRITTAQMEDFVGILRRLWHGEVIFGHDGPAGKFPLLHLDASFDEDIPLGFVAFGPNSLALAGRAFDMVVLHTFFTDETVERCAVRRSAPRPSRPDATRRPCASGRATRPSTTGSPTTLRLKKTVGRLATYLQGYGDLMVADQPVGSRRARRASAPTPSWRRSRARSTAWPTPRRSSTSPRCCPTSGSSRRPPARPSGAPQRVLRQFDLGVDGVIMHGATPTELAPVVDAYRAIRPAGRFDDLGQPRRPR